MEKELQKKIAWFEKRHEQATKMVEELENDRRLDRSTRAQKLLRDAKKEKLRMRDSIQWLKKVENQSQKN